MNKKQLVAKLAGSLNQSKADAERTFDTITNTILDALKGDDSVKLQVLVHIKWLKEKPELEVIQELESKSKSLLLKR